MGGEKTIRFQTVDSLVWWRGNFRLGERGYIVFHPYSLLCYTFYFLFLKKRHRLWLFGLEKSKDWLFFMRLISLFGLIYRNEFLKWSRFSLSIRDAWRLGVYINPSSLEFFRSLRVVMPGRDNWNILCSPLGLRSWGVGVVSSQVVLNFNKKV